MTGIIPECAAELFRLVDERRRDCKVTLVVTVLEIYNNTIRDLLCDKYNDKIEVLLSRASFFCIISIIGSRAQRHCSHPDGHTSHSHRHVECAAGSDEGNEGAL
jgi:hypothetical protein